MVMLPNYRVVVGGDGLDGLDKVKSKRAVAVWDLTGFGEVAYLPTTDAANNGDAFYPQDTFAVSKDMNHLVSTDVTGSQLFAFSLTEGSLEQSVTAPYGVKPMPMFSPPPLREEYTRDIFTSIAFSPDNLRFAACSSLGKLYIYSVDQRKLLDTLQVFEEGVRCTTLTYAYDGLVLIAGRQQLRPKPLGRQPVLGDKSVLEENTGSVQLISTVDGRKIGSIHDFEGSIRDIAWDQASCLLAVADDASLRVWKAGKSINILTTISKVEHATYLVSISGNGLIAAVQGPDVVIYSFEDRN